MTKFEQIGINHQQDATTISEAKQAFRNSCRCCISRGMKINCDRCQISVCHENTMALLNDLQEMQKSKQQGQTSSSHNRGRNKGKGDKNTIPTLAE